ncbi:LysM peptidoglycan-binding domain-containing protein [Candidatus Sumerlaeota bacterium]|nr:LysM peptidoglycan-binding domain-containing protein [Candidatus Sumerlaeota bacterium]
MSVFRFPVFALFVCILFASLLSACTVSSEHAAQMQKLEQRIAALEEFKKTSKSSVEAVYFDMDNLTERVRVIEATAKSGGATAAEIEPVVKRLRELEQRLGAVTTQIQANAEAVATQKNEIKAAVKSQDRKAETVVSAKSDKPVATRVSSRRSGRSATVSRAVPRGFYYNVREGETLQAIARKHNVTSAQICRANRIPMSALIYAGQQIYIPRS